MKKMGLWMIAGAIILTLLVGFTAKESTAGIQGRDRLAAANQQWNELIKLAMKKSEEKLTGVVKWQGTWQVDMTAKEAAEELAQKLGLGEVKRYEVQNHPVYKAQSVAWNSEEIQEELSIIAREKNSLYVVLRIDAHGQGLNTVTQRQEKAGAVLLQAKVDANWNGAIRGGVKLKSTAGQKREGGQLSAETAVFKQLEADLHEAGLRPAALDKYEDENTVTSTYYLPEFEIGIKVQGSSKPIGLQMAVHTDMQGGMQELSWGSPMLTVEY
ncbi:hypothetical protein DCC85_18255 [Paenibacillus sp. CAA11]|uniref:hypothetical protein n=1 Tax=Paenibacillus sp. CAA11 TaxID=1532905 RepID=UPI000D374B03|nr:hypothetical protein [Paenibacillus sp. CAA11]AWB45939.1 hypothetical protein DCC85_18255 [Paenibacillus sp. CAA11]